MSLLSYALTTVAKVKAYLGITSSDYDAVIELIVNQQTSLIEGYCGGRRFLAADYVDVVDAKGGKRLFFNNYPVRTFTSLEYRSGTVSSPTWVTYDANSYLKYLAQGYLQFFGKLPCVPQGMRLTYNAGYLIDFTAETNATLHTLPFDLTMAATELAANEYNRRQAQGITSMTTEGQSITFDKGVSQITGNIKIALDRYKTVRMAI